VKVEQVLEKQDVRCCSFSFLLLVDWLMGQWLVVAFA
jgi:hypothetical protein